MESCASARVVRVWPGRAEVEIQREEACASCASADLCQIVSGRKSMHLEVDDPIGVREGQLVRIGSMKPLGLKAAFFVYMVPALLFVVGVVVGSEILHWSAAPSALMGVGGLLVSWFVARAFERHASAREEYRLCITAVVPVEEGMNPDRSAHGSA